MSNQDTLSTLQDTVVFRMLIDDIKQVKSTLASNQDENRAEFRRLRDKMDALNGDLRKELKQHDKDIATLTAQATIAGRISGFIAGAASSLVIMMLKWALDKFA